MGSTRGRTSVDQKALKPLKQAVELCAVSLRAGFVGDLFLEGLVDHRDKVLTQWNETGLPVVHTELAFLELIVPST